MAHGAKRDGRQAASARATVRGGCAMAGGVIASPGHPYQVDDGVLESPAEVKTSSRSIRWPSASPCFQAAVHSLRLSASGGSAKAGCAIAV